MKDPMLYPILRNVLISLSIIIVTYLFSRLIQKLAALALERLMQKTRSEKALAKTRTINSLLRNILDSIILVILILILFSQWGINILPLLTGAGILGLGFSLGAQTLFKDIIAGFFIIIENQYNVGDRIKVGDFEGEVVKITLRLTVLKDKEGNKIFLTNSQVSAVTRKRAA